MNCVNCDNPLAPGAKFCAVCGTQQVSAPKFCIRCGAQMEGHSQFCMHCGTPVQNQPVAPEVQEQMPCQMSPEETAFSATEGYQQPAVPQHSPAPQHTPIAAAPQPLNFAPAAPNYQQPVQQPIPQPVYAQPQAPVYQAPVYAQPVVQPMMPPVNPGAVAGVATVAGAAVKGAAKTVSVGKTIAIITLVFAFIIGAISACLKVFVPAPEDTVETLIESISEMDYEKMLSCMDSKSENMIRGSLGLVGDLIGFDMENLMALAPAMAPYMEIPDLGIRDAETVLYADCSKAQIIQYCQKANSGEDIPEGYLSDNELTSFLMNNHIKLPGLENLIAKCAIVKITLEDGEVGYLPLINEGWGDWRIPMMEMSSILEEVN